MDGNQNTDYTQSTSTGKCDASDCVFVGNSVVRKFSEKGQLKESIQSHHKNVKKKTISEMSKLRHFLVSNDL